VGHQASNKVRTAFSNSMLLELEDVALELARLAGVEVTNALGRTLAVRYKKSAIGAETFCDPVSEVDHTVEVLVRARVSEQFPEHEIIGEEIEGSRDASTTSCGRSIQ